MKRPHPPAAARRAHRLRGGAHLLLLLVVLLPWPHTAYAQDADHPVVNGVALERTTVGSVSLFYDRDVDPDTLATASKGIEVSLRDVPEVTGLPQFTTPINAYILADDERFRLALAEVAGVRTDLVADEISGYAIERDGTMLVFFGAGSLAALPGAIVAYAHEFAHLAEREATQRRAMPQWFNEGFATWTATRVLERHAPAEAAWQREVDRAVVASGLHRRGLIPWADLVTRTRFSQAGVDGLVGLAYGQSTSFIEYLAQNHGVPALATFLTALGEGTAATPAFAAAFGPFATESAAYEASLLALKAEYPPGLHVLRHAFGDDPAVIVLVGGPALETAVVEFLEHGERVRRREIDLDAAGFLVVSLPASLLNGAGPTLLRVTVTNLGVVEIDPVNGSSTPVPSAAPGPVTAPGPASIPTTPVPTPRPARGPAPIQAPAQLPRAA
jgi:hypothetical protein